MFSQNKIEYANFIQTDTAIKWAAIYSSVVNLTPVNPNFNISNFYFNKFKKDKIRTYTTDSFSFAVYPTITRYSSLMNSLPSSYIQYDTKKINSKFEYDERHDGNPALLYNEANDCYTCLNNKLSLIKVKQLLYYKNNQLQIKNILINPLTYLKKAETTINETSFAETMNVAFDANNTENTSIPTEAIFIGRAGNILTLLPEQFSENKILTTSNWSLFNILFKDIKANKIKAYDTDNSIYPNAAKILDNQKIEEYKNPADTIPIYDETDGSLGQYKIIRRDINTDSVYSFLLVQNFYFDFKNEKLYSKLVALIPQLRYITYTGVYLGDINYFGILFPEEDKKTTEK